MPKSSIASRTPSAFRFSSTSVAASGSASTALSVISRHSSFGSRPLSVSAFDTVATKSPSASWRGETLTETVIGRSTVRTHSAAWRQASSTTHAPIGTIRPGLLGDRDEDGRDDHAALGVVPADQRLGADDLAVVHVDLRLVEQLQLAALERVAQAALEVETLGGLLAHRVVEDLAARLAELLRAVHGGVGVAQQRLRVGDADRQRTHAEARGHEALAAVELDRRAQGAGQAVGDAAGGDLATGAGDHHGELVAAEAGDHVAGTQHAAQALGDDLEQAVAGPVAERVVDDLEVVEVDEQDRDLERLRVGDRLLQALQEERCGSAGRSAGRGGPGSRAGARRPCAWRCRGSGRPSTRAASSRSWTSECCHRPQPMSPLAHMKRRSISTPATGGQAPSRSSSGASGVDAGADELGSSERPVASVRGDRWCAGSTPSRPTMAMPIGASSNAERKRSSALARGLAGVLVHAPGDDVHDAQRADERGVDAGPAPRMLDRGVVREDGVGGQRAHQPVVHEHVQEREQVREPLLVGREQGDHHEEVEVRLDAAVPQVTSTAEEVSSEKQTAAARRFAESSLRPASHANTAIGTQLEGGSAERLARDQREQQQRGDVRPRDRGHRAVALEPVLARQRLAAREAVAPSGDGRHGGHKQRYRPLYPDIDQVAS